MAVCSFDEAVRLTDLDRGYWSVVSIHGPRERRARLPHARTVHYPCLDDTEVEDSSVERCPRAADVAAAFSFIDRLSPGPPLAPLMIHCEMGLSRSPALALAWIYRQLPRNDARAARAIDLLLRLQPQAAPNRLVLRLGLAQRMALSEAQRLAASIVRDPRFQRNRFRALPEEWPKPRSPSVRNLRPSAFIGGSPRKTLRILSFAPDRAPAKVGPCRNRGTSSISISRRRNRRTKSEAGTTSAGCG